MIITNAKTCLVHYEANAYAAMEILSGGQVFFITGKNCKKALHSSAYKKPVAHTKAVLPIILKKNTVGRKTMNKFSRPLQRYIEIGTLLSSWCVPIYIYLP